MSYREKNAWIALVAILIFYGAYFTGLARDASPAVWAVRLSGVILGLVLLQALLGGVAALTTSRAERRARDEREAGVLQRAARFAYVVLAVEVVLGSALLMHGVWPRAQEVVIVSNGLLLAFIVAEAVRYASQIVLLRRGL
jgi:hypothetical protein